MIKKIAVFFILATLVSGCSKIADKELAGTDLGNNSYAPISSVYYSIAGTVNWMGAPCIGAIVTLEKDEGAGVYEDFSAINTGITGGYVFTHIPEGSYRISAVYGEYQSPVSCIVVNDSDVFVNELVVTDNIVSTADWSTESMVNVGTSGDQKNGVVVSYFGGFIVAWVDEDTQSVKFRLYNQSGQAQGGDVVVSEVTHALTSGKPAVGVLSNGNIVVAWNSDEIYAKVVSPTGAVVTDVVRINDFTTSDQSGVGLVVNSSDEIIFVWESGSKDVDGPDGDRKSIQIKRFSSSLIQTGNESTVNQNGYKHQKDPKIINLSDGNILVSWVSKFDGYDYDICVRKYTSTASPVGGEVIVNADRSGRESFATVAPDENGGYVVAWITDGILPAVMRAKGYKSDGSVNFNDIQINQRSYSNPPVDGDGDLDVNVPAVSVVNSEVIFIRDDFDSFDGDGVSIVYSVFDLDGNRLEDETVLNTSTVGDQEDASSAVLANGSVVVTFEGAETTNQDIYLRIRN